MDKNLEEDNQVDGDSFSDRIRQELASKSKLSDENTSDNPHEENQESEKVYSSKFSHFDHLI